MKKLFEIFWVFFKIGAFTIGGGLAMVPLMQKAVSKWIAEDELVDVFSISQSAPGVIAINSSVFIGFRVAGIKGAVAAALGVIMPSFFCILIVFALISNITENVILQKVFTGVRSGVVALVLLSGWSLYKKAEKIKFFPVITAAVVILIAFFGVPVIYLLIAGAIAGLVIR